MKSRFIRITSLILAVLTLSLSLAACGDTPAPVSGDDTVASQTGASGTQSVAETTAEPVETVRLDEYGREWVDDGIAETMDLGQRVFTVHTRGNVEQYEWKADELSGETLNDAIYKRNANVENRLNIKLNIVAEGSWANYEENLNKVKASIQSGDGAYDLLCGYSSPASALATTGLIWNLNKIDAIDFEKPWWSQDFRDSISVGDATFFGVGSLSIAMIYSMYCIFVNTDILSSTENGYDIYKTVLEGSWTWEEMMRLSEKAFVDNNSNGVADAGDIVGFSGHDASNTLNGLFYSTGTKLITRDESGEPKFSVNTEQVSDIVGKIIDLMYNSKSSYIPGKMLNFEEGQVLFFERWLYWGQTVYGKNMDQYGIVPMPKLSKDQASYSTPVQGGMHIYAIPIDVKNPQDAGIITEALAAESYRTLVPAYYEVVLKTRYAKDAYTSQMIDIIYENVNFDMAFIYNSTLSYFTGAISEVIRSKTNSFSAINKSLLAAGDKKLTQLIDGMKKSAEASNK